MAARHRPPNAVALCVLLPAPFANAVALRALLPAPFAVTVALCCLRPPPLPWRYTRRHPLMLGYPAGDKILRKALTARLRRID